MCPTGLFVFTFQVMKYTEEKKKYKNLQSILPTLGPNFNEVKIKDMSLVMMGSILNYWDHLYAAQKWSSTHASHGPPVIGLQTNYS